MNAMTDSTTRKTILITIFFAAFFAALLWLISNVASWVFGVLKATGH